MSCFEGLGKRRTSALTQLGAAGAGEEYIQRIQMLKTAINGAEALRFIRRFKLI